METFIILVIATFALIAITTFSLIAIAGMIAAATVAWVFIRGPK